MEDAVGLIPKVSVPCGKSGAWEVSRFIVDEFDAKMSAIQSAKYGRGYVKPGEYTKLTRNGVVIMSDTSDEMRDHYEPVRRAKGKVLINGLGLGMVLNACLLKPEVEHVTVVELSKDVIDIVAAHYECDKLTIVNDSAFDFSPPHTVRYDVVWHDIWDDICLDNLESMTKLKRKYGRKCDWQGCWCESVLRYRAKREKAWY